MAEYSDRDSYFMNLALREARKGLGRTSPNPCVGAVVGKNDKLLATGYHRRAGAPHAEVVALDKAGPRAKNATLYVTLEPCNHKGRTPPCTERILASNIKRVVVGMTDPNPLVNGGGNAYLASRGLDVTSGVLEEKCCELNRPFIKHITTGMPWVIMKAGLTMDGRIATSTGHSSWISGESSRAQVHRLRDRVDAILIGSGTAIADNPSLTTRLPGRRGRDPLRVVLDSCLNFSPEAEMFNQESTAPTWIFCGPEASANKRRQLEDKGAIVKETAQTNEGTLDLAVVLRELGTGDVTSLLVEGGGRVHASFLRQNLYDQACLFFSPLFIGGDGVPVVGELGTRKVGDGRRFRITGTRRFGDDVMIEGLFE